ncbi:MAG: hypothetical protein ACREGJ_03650 [Candidatus Saccharimonadales bacterium]
MALNKRRLHHWLTVLRYIKLWQLILLFILLAVLSAYLLRQNNLGMVERRNAVKKADEEKSNVKEALTELQRYVSAHMNTNLGNGVFLEHSHQRAYDLAVQETLSATNPTSHLYEQVERECQPVFRRTGSFPAYTQCARDKLGTISPGQDPLASLQAPDSALFRYNFASPRWSLDMAGISVLVTLVVGVLMVLRIVGYLLLRFVLKMRHQ